MEVLNWQVKNAISAGKTSISLTGRKIFRLNVEAKGSSGMEVSTTEKGVIAIYALSVSTS